MKDKGIIGIKNHVLQQANAMFVDEPMDKKILKEGIKHKFLVEFIERFEYSNLPDGITKDLIERIIFYRGKGIMFKLNDKPIFLPFTLKSDKGTGIDIYGRYKKAQPVLFTGTAEGEDTKLMNGDLILDIVYDKTQIEGAKNPGVVLYDSTIEIAQENVKTNLLLNPYVEQLADILVLVNIDLINSAKVYTIIAKDEAQKTAIEEEFQDIDKRIMNGKRAVVVVGGPLDMKELVSQQSTKDASRYFQSYQSLDNIRKELLGISNSGTFLKQEHMTDSETEANSSSGSLVLKNALRQRQEWIELVNAVFGWNISIEEHKQELNNVVGEESSQTKQLEGGE